MVSSLQRLHTILSLAFSHSSLAKTLLVGAEMYFLGAAVDPGTPNPRFVALVPLLVGVVPTYEFVRCD